MQPSAFDHVNYSLVNNLAKNEFKKLYNGIIEYGTAGFRTQADILNHVLYRIGLLTVLRSQHKKAAIGLMITASHNPEEDNGVKIVDPAGEMLEASWETIATKLANVEDEEVVSTLQTIISENNIDTSFPATVIVGRDTRKSSLALSQAAIQGVKVLNGNLQDFGVVTTPQLHYLLVCTNTNGNYGKPSVEGYYEKICSAYKILVGNKKDNGKYIGKIQLDAANGVGALAVTEFQKRLASVLEIEMYNKGEGQLNYRCGADYVKMQQVPPINVPLKPYARCVTIDGDADRVVYYYTDEQNKFHLMDGDRIATLVAAFFQELLFKSNLDLNLGLVQTAYANGSSTEYISKNLKIPVACASTGVKHLHHKALEFDIGVYFEANGHGTVVFKDSAIEIIQNTANNKSLSQNQCKAAETMLHVIDVINQTVGDALSDVLLVEFILHAKGWSIVDWEESYEDLPNKQVKVKIQDKNVITTSDAGRICVTPKELQDRINQIVTKYPSGRSFVRPSGTEDIVRVYAECKKASDVEKLSSEVCLAVYELSGGIGPKPTVPSL